ncbi:hypothetical protein Pmani_021831 [Petrolisthes manimaculis]|uniref:Uncharacterized protein n=1 Tax=Petrolisthes manimaculis TaxID=1843537 RepID=A0AAE1PE00_9EUCA|nr:hypothetical protein Pmani_021831 [Petrolisthes manimaculis]
MNDSEAVNPSSHPHPFLTPHPSSPLPHTSLFFTPPHTSLFLTPPSSSPLLTPPSSSPFLTPPLPHTSPLIPSSPLILPHPSSD